MEGMSVDDRGPWERQAVNTVRQGGARMRCFKCGHIWIRQIKPSKGQLIRCPACRITLGIMSTPIKMMSVKEYMGTGIDNYVVKDKK